jgi:hypothetical protein
MADQRLVTTVLHVDGVGGPAVVDCLNTSPMSVGDVAELLGVTFRTEYRREPWTQAELDRGALESEVAKLRGEFPDGDYPVPTHSPDEPCTFCEALRFLEDHG